MLFCTAMVQVGKHCWNVKDSMWIGVCVPCLFFTWNNSEPNIFKGQPWIENMANFCEFSNFRISANYLELSGIILIISRNYQKLCEYFLQFSGYFLSKTYNDIGTICCEMISIDLKSMLRVWDYNCHEFQVPHEFCVLCAKIFNLFRCLNIV